MAVAVEELIDYLSDTDITYISGYGKYSRRVTWVSMAETLEDVDFLNKGELAFTTGLALNEETTLLDIVSGMYEQEVSALIINLGPFISEVPNDVIEFSTNNLFPIFTVPWSVHLSDVMKKICLFLTRDEQRNQETSAAFKNSILFPKQEELYTVPLSQNGFQVDWRYACCVIHIENVDSNALSRVFSISAAIDIHIKHSGHENCLIFTNDTEILAVVANYSEIALKHLVEEIHYTITSLLLDNEVVYIGVGKITKSIRCLYKSYYQAKSILSYQKNQGHFEIAHGLIFYSDMGIYKLLLAVDDKDILSDYLNETLGPVIEYDKANNSDLVPTLKAYLYHNGSAKETAEELFVHRNTVNYKINKIESLLDIDMSSLSSKLQLSVAFHIMNMM